MAGWNALTGARGIVAAFAMSILLQLGIVDVTVGLLLCAVISGIGALLYTRAASMVALEAAESPEVVPDRTSAPSLVGRAVADVRSAVAR